MKKNSFREYVETLLWVWEMIFYQINTIHRYYNGEKLVEIDWFYCTYDDLGELDYEDSYKVSERDIPYLEKPYKPLINRKAVECGLYSAAVKCQKFTDELLFGTISNDDLVGIIQVPRWAYKKYKSYEDIMLLVGSCLRIYSDRFKELPQSLEDDKLTPLTYWVKGTNICIVQDEDGYKIKKILDLGYNPIHAYFETPGL